VVSEVFGLVSEDQKRLDCQLRDRFTRCLGNGDDSETGSERETGLEPATLCLGSRCSTTELLPRECCYGYWY
jgi:hypothetical protein